MTRRQRKHPPSFLKFAIVAVFALGALITIIQHMSAAFFVLLLLAAGGAITVWQLMLPARLRKSAFGKAALVTEQHIDQLTRRRAQLVQSDAYGKLQFDKWAKEVEYFITNHILPGLSGAESTALKAHRSSITRLVMERVERSAAQRPLFREFSNSFTPADFEMFCAEQLRLSGWDARVTLQSRDQGVDVIADKAGIRVVLQCKLYSGTVGNKAVQEVVAARAHEQAHYGVVVTNSRYTAPAEELAATNGVLLLHYTDLRDLDHLLRDSIATRVRQT